MPKQKLTNTQRFELIENELAQHGTDIRDIKVRLGSVENKLGGVENRLDGVENKLDGMDEKLNALDEILLEVKSINESFQIHSPKHKEIASTLSDHSKRIKRVEQELDISTAIA